MSLYVDLKLVQKGVFITRMQFSRMRTVHCSGCLIGGVCLVGGVCPGGCLHWGGVCLGGVCLGDVWLGGVCLGGCTPPPGTEFLTHACENITSPQLRLRTVILRL